ncbi:hypothetical protein [Streptomyces griseus]|uniref:hypothetical protein n=1 Tax=Streptomyces griseus TaxID=1911 RepID=UPI001112DECB|nr:hypothetical protein [Streptomyces griseus]
MDLGAVETGAPGVEALKRLPHLVGRTNVAARERDQSLLPSSWRGLMRANPDVEPFDGISEQRCGYTITLRTAIAAETPQAEELSPCASRSRPRRPRSCPGAEKRKRCRYGQEVR